VAIAYRSGSSASNNTTCNKPTGVVNNDCMVAFVAVFDASSITAPSGWTLVATYSKTSPNMHVFVYTKIAASEGASYTWTTGVYTDIIISASSGTDTTTPYDTSAGAYNSGALTCPTVTPIAGAADFLICAFMDNAAPASVTGPPAGMTADQTSLDLDASAYLLLSSSAATGAKTFGSSGGSPDGIGVSVVLKPAGSGSTGLTVSGAATVALKATGLTRAAAATAALLAPGLTRAGAASVALLAPGLTKAAAASVALKATRPLGRWWLVGCSESVSV
jgi:hypothetical protein